jgi:hypothetical protein
MRVAVVFNHGWTRINTDADADEVPTKHTKDTKTGGRVNR